MKKISLSTLLKKQPSAAKDSYYFSFYHPLFLDQSKLKTSIRSTIKKATRELDQFATKTEQNLITSITQQIDLLKKADNHTQGIALFAQISKDELSKNTSKDSLSLRYFSTNSQLKPFATFGKTFELRPLIKAKQNNLNALILTITEKQAVFKELVGKDVRELNTITNKFTSESHNRYIEKTSVNSHKSFFHGTGSEKVTKQQESGNTVFLRSLKSNTQQLLESKNYSQLVIIHSNKFSTDIPSFVETVSHNSTVKVIVIDSLLQTDEEIYAVVKNYIEKETQQIVEQTLHQLNSSHYVAGWKAVADAVRAFKVKTLIIDPLQSTIGYIQKGNLTYTYPALNTKKVENLAAWLTQTVLQAGGKVVISNKLSKSTQIPVMAELRY